MLGVPVEHINKQIIWHQKFMPGKEFIDPITKKLNPALINETGAPEAYGITTIEEVVKSNLPVLESKI